jgi:hypothetical protein
MSDRMDITAGPPDTVLQDAPAAAAARLAAALDAPVSGRREAVADVARAFPSWPAVWAELGDVAGDEIEAYAYYRVGYHRGLDALRQQGWRGNGYVRWSHPSNLGFLRCLDGLRVCAAAIGETVEEQRCEAFLHQLDPAWRLPR